MAKGYDLFETEDGLQIQREDEGSPFADDREATICCISDAFDVNDEAAKDMIVTMLMERFDED